MGRKKPNIHYIYKTICNVTKRYYIGMHSTSNLEDGYLGSGKRLRYSIRKYGKENHTKEILEFLSTREKLVIRESEIVNKILLTDKLCMNLKEGGQGGFVNLKAVKKGREKTDKILFEKYGKDFRKLISKKYQQSITKEERVRINDKIKKTQEKNGFDYGSTFRGKKHKEESKNNIGKKNSINQKGKNNSQFGTCWITNGSDNKKIYKGDLIPKGWRLGRVITKK
jgi:hypothetical protein